jgi:hypothetical protein
VFIAGVWNTAENTATLYLDQRVARSNELDVTSLPQASEDLWLGVRDGSNMSVAKGMRFDDFRFYDQALSASQIAAIRAGETNP